MRILPLIIYSVITVGLVIALDVKLTSTIPPLGKLLSPQHGFWQNAENSQADFNADLKFPGLKGKVNVYLDERLVPHVFAEDENDIYFVQDTCTPNSVCGKWNCRHTLRPEDYVRSLEV